MTTQIPQDWFPGFPVTTAGFLRISASQVGAETTELAMILFHLNQDLPQKLGKDTYNFAIPRLNLFH